MMDGPPDRPVVDSRAGYVQRKEIKRGKGYTKPMRGRQGRRKRGKRK